MAQINAIKSREWAAEARNRDAMLKYIEGIADTLNSAQIRQFPEKF